MHQNSLTAERRVGIASAQWWESESGTTINTVWQRGLEYLDNPEDTPLGPVNGIRDRDSHAKERNEDAVKETDAASNLLAGIKASREDPRRDTERGCARDST
jgi:hypothetical protein